MLSLAMRPHAVMGDGTLARRTVFIKNSQRVDRDTLARTMRAPAASRRGCRGVRAAAPSSPPRPCADAPDDSVHRARSAALAASAMMVRPPSSARPRRAPGAKRPRAGVTPLRAFFSGEPPIRRARRVARRVSASRLAALPSPLHPPPRRPPDPSSPPPPDPRNVFPQAAAAPAASAWAAANNDLAQTAAFGGPDAWIRGALAVTALSSSYAVFSSAVSKSPSAKSPAAASSSSATAETEEAVAADAEARRLRDALERAEAESAALRRENASLAARVDEVTAKLTRDTAHLEKSLRREQTAKEELSADAARFKAAAEASAEKGERTAELAADLESKIEALRVAAEEEKAGFGRELVDEATRAAQLADQLQATQRTANKLAAEVEGYRRDADAFNAKRLLDHTRLRAAEDKIAAVERKRDEEKAAAAERERTLERAAKDAQRDARSARAEAKALAERLEETERRLELERAGSLAEAKRRAMAMLGRDPSPDADADDAEAATDVAAAMDDDDDEESVGGVPPSDAARRDLLELELDRLEESLAESQMDSGGGARGPSQDLDFGVGPGAPAGPAPRGRFDDAVAEFLAGEKSAASSFVAAEGQQGEWLQAYDTEREIHYWYNNVTMETAWELPEGARVRGGRGEGAGDDDDDLPKHFEGPSGLNAR